MDWPYDQERVDEPAAAPPVRLLRLVVSRSDIFALGAVAVIDSREGGIQIGRDRASDRLRLKEMQVSKMHATVYFGQGGEWDDAWFVVDAGSTHGTFVDENRLSEAKTASKPCRLDHMSRLRIGSTVFVVHIHTDWPCNDCQLGGHEIRLETGATKPHQSMTFQPKLPMAQLKAKLLAGHEELKPTGSYIDRSALRRARRSVSPPPSFGNKILKLHGWKPGQGLGRDGQGRVEALTVKERSLRLGLGEAEDWKERAKRHRYKEY